MEFSIEYGTAHHIINALYPKVSAGDGNDFRIRCLVSCFVLISLAPDLIGRGKRANRFTQYAFMLTCLSPYIATPIGVIFYLLWRVRHAHSKPRDSTDAFGEINSMIFVAHSGTIPYFSSSQWTLW